MAKPFYGCSYPPPLQQRHLALKSNEGLILYTDKFDDKLYKDLGPFTERPNALFIPGDNVPRPLFTKRGFYLYTSPNNKIDGRPELKKLKCPDISGLTLNTPSYYFAQEADQLQKIGIGDFTIIDKKLSNYFPKSLKSENIAELGPGTGYYAHNWTRLTGENGKIYMVDLDPFAVGFMEYKFSVENKKYGDKNQIVIIRNKNNNPCLPKNKIKLIFAQALHAYITSMPEGMSLADYKIACQKFWQAIDAAMLYDKKDPAKLIIIDHCYDPNKATMVQFTQNEAIERIVATTNFELEDAFWHKGKCEGWVAVFAKVKI